MAFSNGQGGNVVANSVTLAVESWELTHACEALESTTTGSAGWKESIAGIKSWEGSIKTFLDSAITYFGGAGGLDPGNAITLVLTEGSTGKTLSGIGRVINAKLSNPARGILPFEISFEGTGALATSI